MKYATILLILVLSFGCKNIKRFTKYNIQSNIEFLDNNSSTLGLIENEIKIDLNNTEIEVIKYEPIYYQQNGKDTVVLAQTIYRKSNITKTEQQTSSIDTTQTSTTKGTKIKIQDNSTVEEEVKSVIGEIAKEFLAPIAKYSWIIGLLLIVPIIFWLRKKYFNIKSKF